MNRLFTHNDLDGVGCGIVARLAFNDKVEIRYNSVTSLDYQVERFLEGQKEKRDLDTMLWITDLSVHDENAERLEQYVKEGGKVRLIDHHKTALGLNKHEWGMVQTEYEDGRLTSATSLLYEYLLREGLIEKRNSLEEFVELVRQYDTWEWDANKNLKAKQLNDLFFMGSIDEFEDKIVERIKNNDHFEYDEFEKKLLDMEDDKIERYLKRKKRQLIQSFIGEHCVGIVHAESYHSELGNELGKDNPHLDYISILNMSGKKISFRTIHDHTDVSQVAQHYGGGGHAKAAGCTMTEEAFRLFVKDVFHLEPVKADANKNYFNVKGITNGTLYENRKGERYLIYKKNNEGWVIQRNNQELDKSFSSFSDAEQYLKRHHSAWLVKDEVLVGFLKDRYFEAEQ